VTPMLRDVWLALLTAYVVLDVWRRHRRPRVTPSRWMIERMGRPN
jgi:hypothetical protein